MANPFVVWFVAGAVLQLFWIPYPKEFSRAMRWITFFCYPIGIAIYLCILLYKLLKLISHE